MILAGDIGGTKTRLALFDEHRLTPARVVTYSTAAQRSFTEVVELFLAGGPAKITSACFGVAGPVQNGSVVGVNLPWPVDAYELADVLGVPAVALVNDLQANARGVELLGSNDLAVLNNGSTQATGNLAVVSAGTGLGEAALWSDGQRRHALASEGGHADFAPRSPLEVELYRYLAAELGHVSYERVCSGRGLVNIHRFLRDADPGARRNGHVEPDATAISAEAAADRSSLSARALDLFASIYGARAGNVALAFMATGGVYLGGGIAPKILWKLTEGGFMRSFVGSGRFAPLLERIPVRVILNDSAALLGAARIAAEHSPLPQSTS